MNEKKVFLSLGFKGRSRDEVLDRIQKMKDCLNKNKPEDVEYDFYHNYYCTPPRDDFDVKHKSIYYLGVALNILSKCDIMFVSYEDVINDCNDVDVELNAAVRYNIPLILYFKDNCSVLV